MEPESSLSEGPLSCPICQKQFGQRSTLGRHARQCLEKQLSRPRQKACNYCARRKLKCDRAEPGCSRCGDLGIACQYVTPVRAQTTAEPARDAVPSVIPSDIASNITPPSSVVGGESDDIDAVTTAISSATDLGAQEALLSRVLFRSALDYLSRVFRTYPKMLVTCEKLPPFIHRTHITAPNVAMPLANCVSLCRMWASSSAVVAADSFVVSSIKSEMKRLLQEYHTYDDVNLVAAFQATLIYAIILLFPAPQQPATTLFDIATLAELKELGRHMRATTAMLPEELSHTRPPWQSWLHISCKRRALLCLYLFEWINALTNEFADFPCNKAQYMPAPAGKVLWEAADERTWEVAYDRWLGRWAGLDMFTLGDLELAPAGPTVDVRTEMWLEEFDDLGMLCMTMANTKVDMSTLPV